MLVMNEITSNEWSYYILVIIWKYIIGFIQSFHNSDWCGRKPKASLSSNCFESGQLNVQMNKLLTELWRKTARHFYLEMEWKHNHWHKVKEKMEVSNGESALLCASVLRSPHLDELLFICIVCLQTDLAKKSCENSHVDKCCCWNKY